jgi:ABC-type transport system involved in cytochrome c biogenesis permease subunit
MGGILAEVKALNTSFLNIKPFDTLCDRLDPFRFLQAPVAHVSTAMCSCAAVSLALLLKLIFLGESLLCD